MPVLPICNVDTKKQKIKINKKMDVEEIVHEIVDSAYKVQRVLGLGFLENVYTNALAYELRKRGIPCEREYTVKFGMKESKWAITVLT